MVITDIATSRTAEIRARERKYVITMLIRVLCFVLATLLFSGPARWIAMAAAVFLPWLAVIFANQPRVQRSHHAAYVPPARPETPALSQGRERQVIDHES